MDKVKAAFFTNNPNNIDYVYSHGRRETVAELTDLYPVVITQANFAEHAAALSEVEAIFSTWGMWAFDEATFAAMPKLKSVYYGAGATDHFARPLLAHGIELYSAWLANAIPVAEFCVAQIILGMKGFFRNSRDLTGPEMFVRTPPNFAGPGNYGETVALIGAGAIAQKTIELLKPYNLKVVLVPSRPERRTVSIEEVFRTAFVVSNHLPNRTDNVKVIGEAHFESMRPGAVFINTGRGAQVDEDAMIRVFKKRPDLTALLDVTFPEPPEAGSELYTLPNIHLSAHIAGSLNDEVNRMADFMIDEFGRRARGEAVLYRINESMLMTN